MAKQERHLYLLIWMILAGFAAAGFAEQGVRSTLRGVWDLQAHPARLLTDFTAAVGEGAALVNAALVAAAGLALVRLLRIRLSGPTLAAVFTMLGFGLFGKTPANSLPIIAGVFLSARIAGKRFQEYALIALFGTSLGPLVSMLALEVGAATPLNILAAAGGGVAAGVLLPPLAMAMLRLHQGFNLYNIGLTAGFLGLFAAAVVSASAGPLDPGRMWNPDPSPVMRLAVPVLAALLAGGGLLLGGRGALGDFLRILRLPGRLPTDFMEAASASGGLVNMGLMGLAAWLYVTAVGGPLNGPVLGGVLTVVGFSSFGKHPRNTWPVLAGVAGATVLYGKGLASPGPLLAALFGTTLAPLAGEFGPLVGLLAGFIHLGIVERTGSWHLGVNLYNNGFAGGLTAAFLVAVIEWYRGSRRAERSVKEQRPARGLEENP